MSLGQRLIKLRKMKKLSQEEMAEKLNVTRQTISKWETDQSTPDFDKIVPLCKLFEITTDETSCFGFCFNFKYANLDANLDAGNITLYSFSKAHIEISYGNVKQLGHAKQLDIEMKSGDVEINDVDNLIIDSAYGDINIKKVNEYFDINENYGDIKIKQLKIQKFIMIMVIFQFLINLKKYFSFVGHIN